MHDGIYWVTVACLLMTANDHPSMVIRIVSWAALLTIVIGRSIFAVGSHSYDGWPRR